MAKKRRPGDRRKKAIWPGAWFWRDAHRPGLKKVTWHPGGKIDIRIVMAVKGIRPHQLREHMGWTQFIYEVIVSSQTPIWPAERAEIARFLEIHPPSILAVKMKDNDHRRPPHQWARPEDLDERRMARKYSDDSRPSQGQGSGGSVLRVSAGP